MLVVFGSALDEHPRVLVEHGAAAGHEIALVTPADLSRPGWRLRRGNARQARAAVDGRIVRGEEVGAVICALPWVGPYDLPHVVEHDRDYIAQEMGAFLLAWLDELDCPVVDTPTPMSLAGSGRSRYEWTSLAASLGIAADPDLTGETTTVTVVHGKAVGPLSPETDEAAEAVASAAGSSLLTLRFATHGPPTLVGAEVRPEVGHPAVADELLDWLDPS